MKLGVVSMIRNEGDIIAAFLRHLDALFDYAVLMEHHAIDGTARLLAEACARRAGWALLHLEPVGKHQQQVTRFAVAHVFRNTDADFVMALDADEFVAVPDRATLEHSLTPLRDPDRIGYLFWRNLVPDRFDERAFGLDELVWRAPRPGAFGKVVIPRAFHQRHGAEALMTIGNHGMYYPPDRIVPSQPVGELLHLPVRSPAQLGRKVVAGVYATSAQMVRQAAQSRHQFEMLRRIAEDELREEDLIGIAAEYDTAEIARQSLSREGLAARGFTLGPAGVAAGRSLVPDTAPAWTDPLRLVATILQQHRVEDTRGQQLVIDGDRVRFAAIHPG